LLFFVPVIKSVLFASAMSVDSADKPPNLYYCRFIIGRIQSNLLFGFIPPKILIRAEEN
jgi:hypothetical protein